MIEWNDDFTEPLLTKDISDDNLKNFIVNFSENNPIFKFLCHNQAVERHVKLVTECSAKICGQEKQNQLAKSIIHSRKKMPKFETTKEYIA